MNYSKEHTLEFLFHICVHSQHINIKMKASSAHLGNNILSRLIVVSVFGLHSVPAHHINTNTHSPKSTSPIIEVIIGTQEGQQHSLLAFTPTLRLSVQLPLMLCMQS